MRMRFALLGAGLALAAAGTVQAAPSVAIERAAVRVTVIPEARSDVTVQLIRANARLPIYIKHRGDQVVVYGDLDRWFFGCSIDGEDVHVFPRGHYRAAELPEVVIRTPMDSVVWASGASIGSVARSHSLALGVGGCGDWTVANVEGQLSLGNSGSGRVRTGSAGSADVSVSGSGETRLGPVANRLRASLSGSGVLSVGRSGSEAVSISGSGDMTSGPVASGLRASISGSGNLDVARLDGPFEAGVSGVGHIRASQGEVSTMEVHISGSGDVAFGGVAQSLEASVSGSGNVSAKKVTGEVTKHVSGSGQVEAGR